MIKTSTHTFDEFNLKSKIPLRIWPHFDLIYIHSGKMFLRLMKKEEISLNPGQAILMYPETFFQGHSLVNLTRFSVHHFEFQEKTDNNFSSIEYLRHKKSGFEVFKKPSVTYIEDDIKRAAEIHNDDNTEFTEDMMSSLMLLILDQLKINSKKRHISENYLKFESLLLWMNQNMHKNLNLNDMAEQMNISASHFRSLFKSEIGISPWSYLLDIRMKEAARQLRETLHSIKEIANEVGYNEVTHFYRAFKLHHSTTPKIYREKHKLQW